MKGGYDRLEYDLVILNDIQDQILNAQGESKTDGKKMEARKRQRRQARKEVSDGEAIELLKQGGFM